MPVSSRRVDVGDGYLLPAGDEVAVNPEGHVS
jgi:hypothetical protein